MTRRVQQDAPDATSAQRDVGAGIVGEDHALWAEERAVADTDQRTKFLVDVEMIGKVNIFADVHAAFLQGFEPVNAPDAVQPSFQTC